MTTATKQEEVTIEAVTKHVTRNTTRTEPSTSVASLTSQQIWHALEKGSFGIISYVTPTGEPRSSGVMYKAQGHRLYVVVAPESWSRSFLPSALPSNGPSSSTCNSVAADPPTYR